MDFDAKNFLKGLEDSFRENPLRTNEKAEIEGYLNEAVLSRETRNQLVVIRNNQTFTQQEMELAREIVRKEKARRTKQILDTRRKNRLAALEKEIRSDRTLPKLQKMQMIREIQRQRANL